MKTVDQLLLDRITELELELERVKTLTYIHEINTIHAYNGELTLSYGDGKMLVMEIEGLYKDLPSIIGLVCKEQEKMQQDTLECIKEELEKL